MANRLKGATLSPGDRLSETFGRKRPVAAPKFLVNRLPETDEELWWWVRAIWGIKIPRTRVCPDHSTPFDAFADAYFARSPISIWKASRGFGGKSYLLATLALTEAASLGAQISLLGGSGAQSLNVHNHTQELWTWPHAPRNLWEQDPTKYDTHLTNHGHIRSLTASQTSVRGPHPQRLRLDEIDEMDLDILTAAQGQPMRKWGIETQTVMSSTHQHPDGTMTAMLKEARKRGWTVHHWCYRETSNPVDGWLTIDEVERKRGEVPIAMWEAEYDLQEPNFEGRAIDAASVAAAFDIGLGEFSGDRPVVIEDPQPGVRYVTAVDWAKERDRTIVGTYKFIGDEMFCVAWQGYNRLPWPQTIATAVSQWWQYGGTFIHDATGLGNVVHDLIKDAVPPHMVEKVKPYVMTGGAPRGALFSEYISGIEQGRVHFPRIELAYDEHRYVTHDDLFGRGHPPDSVVSGAIAWTLRDKTEIIAPPISITKESLWLG